MSDYGPCPYHGIVTYRNALKYSGIRSDPDILAEHYRSWMAQLAPLRLEKVVERGEDDIVADLTPVSDDHPSMVLKMAARIDEHALPD